MKNKDKNATLLLLKYLHMSGSKRFLIASVAMVLFINMFIRHKSFFQKLFEQDMRKLC